MAVGASYIYPNTTTGTGVVNVDVSYIWHEWSDAVTSISTTDAIWTSWSDNVITSAPAIIMSPEAIAGLEADMRRIETEHLEKLRMSREADKVAETLLLKHLLPQQREDYQQRKYFELLSKDGKRRYRIKHGWAGNVQVFEEDRLVERLCIHPTIDVPNCDNMLAQKLMLEADEELFRKTANISKLAGMRVA